MLPIIKAARLIPILVRAGFRIVRQVGSHVHLEHISDRTRKITVPMHPKPLPKKTLFSILKQAGLTLQEFLKILGK
ncbi:MAG: type II toxin-antitoxin system HicA family toxin [Candidatus Sungiibacteriota bacterium]